MDTVRALAAGALLLGASALMTDALADDARKYGEDWGSFAALQPSLDSGAPSAAVQEGAAEGAAIIHFDAAAPPHPDVSAADLPATSDVAIRVETALPSTPKLDRRADADRHASDKAGGDIIESPVELSTFGALLQIPASAYLFISAIAGLAFVGFRPR